MNLTIYTDGGSRGNPGLAAIGVVIEQGSEKKIEFGKRIGVATNNVAEYTAVLEALQYVQEQSLPSTDIHFFLDSLLVVNQMNGLFKVKDVNLQMLLQKIRSLEQQLHKKITYTHVPREQNREADKMVNLALDNLI